MCIRDRVKAAAAGWDQVKPAVAGVDPVKPAVAGVDPVKPAVAGVGAMLKYEGIGPYNYRMCQGAEYLGSCYTEDQVRGVIAGTLSHSHLLLVLLCIATGAKWKVAGEDGTFIYPCDREGCIDTAAVAARQEVLKLILTEGLDMELLGYKIYLEEPNACMLISSALNHAQKVALKMTELSALSALTGAVGLSAVAGKVHFNSVKESLRSALDVMVDDPEFVEMFDFVVRMGADKNTYLPEFLKFTSKCVSSQFRRLGLQTFAALNKCKAGPLSKVALCKRSLRSKPGAGGYCPAPESELEKRSEGDFQNLEDALLFFHRDCRAAVAALIPEGEMPLFLGNVDCSAAEAFVKTDSKHAKQYKRNLVAATAKYWKQLHEKDRGRGGVHAIAGQVSFFFPAFQEVLDETEKAKAASAVADTAKLAEPILICYNEATSESTTVPDIRFSIVAATERTRLPWVEWMATDVTDCLLYTSDAADE